MLTLQILRSELLEGKYLNSWECPITKALARAGRPDLHDQGITIRDRGHNIIIGSDNSAYKELSDKVSRMSLEAGNPDYLEAADFTIELPI